MIYIKYLYIKVYFMIFYYGIRPTGDNLHLGHVMSLFDMFDKIKSNIVDISNIYILLAETHAEISPLTYQDIRNNSKSLAKNIIALFKSYLIFNDIQSLNIIDKIKFIFQNDMIGYLHRDITYKYLPLLNSNDVLTSPIYSNSKINNVAFLIYPILQAFDVLLYSAEKEDTTVFVSGDQQANVNIMKDVYAKLKIQNKIKFAIYENVVYDYKCNEKMSKSLNNFIEFDNFDEIDKYIKKYKTFSRASTSAPGILNECPFHENMLYLFEKYLNCSFSHKNMCPNGRIGCGECKQILSKYLKNVINLYVKFKKDDIKFNTPDENIIKLNYFKILNLIDKTRSC